MNNKVVTTILGAAALTGSAFAGPAPVVADEPSCGSWCDTLKTIGTVYSNKENPWVQQVKFFGRAQVQYGYVDGSDRNGDDFNQDFDEVRRLRFGGEVKFLNGFKLKANANFVRDLKPIGGERQFGYQNFDQAKLSYTFKDLLGFDKSSITYGRYKVALGHEQHTSSKKIKTVERSAIANKLTLDRGTGGTIDLERGAWTGTLGVFSTDSSGELLGSWDQGTSFYASTTYGLNAGDLIFDFMYNDQEFDGLPYLQAAAYEWALSGAYETEVCNWGLMANAVVGDNGDQGGNADRQGLFYGFVGLATRDLIEDKLEFVGRYAYQGAEGAEGVRLNSRYVRRASGSGLSDGRGDAHHALYAGLNWYMCGDNSKVMTGVEYDNLNSNGGDNIKATTLWLAYRMYF